jgi:thioredoxin 1
MVKEVTDNDFEQEVLKSALPAMVDMWAPWCGPCRMLGPVVEKLAEDFKDKVKVCKLNVDENPQTASAYGVRSIPLVLFFKNGQKVDESLGAVPENILRPKVEALL